VSRAAAAALAVWLLAGAGCGEAEPGAGAELRARGNEPGWHLEIDAERGLRLVTDYGARELVAPDPTRETGTDATTYRGTAGDHDVRVVVTGTTCQDTMSGERFPLSVRVEVDGEALSGCGERPE
jgi:putative lipoprotein